MNKIYTLLLLFIPVGLFSQVDIMGGLLQIDVTVKVLSADSEELWSVDVTKYTVSERSIGLHLQGFDGDLYAEMTPIIIDTNSLLLQTACIVKSLESGNVIVESEKELLANFSDEIILYPIGNRENSPKVIMIMYINKQSGAGD